MATNNDFLKILIKDTTFHWPRLDQPYRYNNAEKRTEACAPTVNGAGYSIAFDMPMAEARALFTTLKDHYNRTREGNRKLPEFKQVFGMKKDDESGTVRFTAKKRAVSNDGKVNKPPVVIDAAKQDLADKAIWSGSKGNIRMLAFPTVDPDGAGGISLLLDVVQVVEAQYGGDGLDDFDAVSPARSIAEDEDFGSPSPAPQAAKPASTPLDAEF